jgi:hypothetical protein
MIELIPGSMYRITKSDNQFIGIFYIVMVI